MEEMQSLAANLSIAALKDEKNPKNKTFSQYLKLFFAESVGRDFAEYQEKELLNLAASSFDFFSKKPSNNFKLRIYNPTKQKHGFESPYTILEAINDDMSFLVDTIVMQCDNLGIDIKNIIHPIFTTERNSKGILTSFDEKKTLSKESFSDESVVQLHLIKIFDDEIEVLEKNLNETLKTVKFVNSDWPKMMGLISESKSNLENGKIKLPNKNIDLAETRDFIDWMASNKFIFLGVIEFAIENKSGKYSYKEVSGSRLGIYQSNFEITKPTIVNVSSREIEDVVKNPYLVEILKSRYKCQIHRSANAERIRIQKFDENGLVIGEYRILGLFTSSVYYQNPKNIPIVRKKIQQVIIDSKFNENGSKHKDLLSALESYPREELFQITRKDLLRIAVGIVSMSGRSLVRMFVRKDKFERFVSCLIFVPRDNFSTSLREKIQNLIARAYKGTVSDVFVKIADSNLTRIHLVVRTDGKIPKINFDHLEKELIQICRLWSDDFEDEIIKGFDEKEERGILNLYKNAFSVSYKNYFSARQAFFDIRHINKSLESGKVISDIYKSRNAKDEIIELKVYSPYRKLPLSQIMPALDSFGFNVVLEHTYPVYLPDKKEVWVHYFNINFGRKGDKLTDKIKKNFIETADKICTEETVIGHLNRLVLSSGLNFREVYLLRAYSRYLYQIGLRYSQHHLSDVLVRHHNLTKLLIELFETKFNPNFKGNRKKETENILERLKRGLSNVTDVAEDTIIRRITNIVNSTLRTNFYQKTIDGDFKEYLSFKFDPSKIIDIPLPVMHAEIFVYGVGVEGIHLRGGKVARGGLRWSDRHNDFRVEVLGLAKAQMTKNAVIVPVGSKGGFVVKKNIEGLNRDEVLAIGIKSYKNFLRGLLDLTDNVIDGKIVYPENVVRYDEEDPYLVVAADKGTATFSDIANEVSAEYGFWLGDAFASGGSDGYDHKKMGITAKGAWVAVQRHFAEMGVDTQTQNFTCVGVGDLSGDVFGNGMLLSKHIKLLAAFNHMHIFIDPNPSVANSFKERKRIFNLPRSSWENYDLTKISKGGGIFSRNAKSIKLSIEARMALGIEEDKLTPNQLISAILKSPVDLLWNGGIGTYVKCSTEGNVDAGDRINDVLRVNGNDLRCKVVGEGGNLGLTQKGRIEASLNGVRINTDAMDNSAGVACSDREVNIKIALSAAMKSEKVSLKERNVILEKMSDEVSALVLKDNESQTSAISITQSEGYLGLGAKMQFLNNLEHSGLLNRSVEFLPADKEILKRQADKVGMTRPELCVILSYSKMDLYPKILDSELVKDTYFNRELSGYFPTLLQKKFPEEIKNHQLKSEIIATLLTNSVIDKAGITFVDKIAGETGFSSAYIVRNYVIVRDSFNLNDLWRQIDELSGKVDIKIRSRMFATIHKLMERCVVWLLRHQHKIDIETAIVKYNAIATQLFDILDDILAKASRESYNNKIKRYHEGKVPMKLAKMVAALDPLASAFDIAEIANKSNFNIREIAKIYFEVGTRFSLKWLRGKVSTIAVDNYWQKLALKSISEDLYDYQMKIAKEIVEFSCKNKDICPVSPSMNYWVDNNEFMVKRYDDFVGNLKENLNPDLSNFVVALSRARILF